MRKLDIRKSALKSLADLPPKHFKQVQTAIYKLMANPMPHDARELKGHAGVWRCTAGEYRVIYQFTDTDLNVIIIDKRNDDEAYKQLDRM
jgi:mRNA interferase RelE/StbE